MTYVLLLLLCFFIGYHGFNYFYLRKIVTVLTQEEFISGYRSPAD